MVQCSGLDLLGVKMCQCRASSWLGGHIFRWHKREELNIVRLMIRDLKAEVFPNLDEKGDEVLGKGSADSPVSFTSLACAWETFPLINGRSAYPCIAHILSLCILSAPVL